MSFLDKHINENRLPVMDQPTFERITNEIGKEKFREELAEYIAEKRPPFPLKQISIGLMEQSFKGLLKQDVWEYAQPKEQAQKTIFEKYDDYKYNFKEHGLGIIDAPSIYNDVSNHFHQKTRLNCSSYSFKSPLDVWYNGTAKDIWRCLGPMWRGINGMKPVMVAGKEELRGGKLDEASYLSAFRLQTYIATQFKPIVAKAIYEMTNAGRVLDTSCGWGDRLAGFYASNACEYIGCDPNPNVYETYMDQVSEYELLLGNKDPLIRELKNADGIDYFECLGKKHIRIFRCGAEDLPWDQIKDVDCAFTSPPYFATEQYNEGGEHEEDQSWKKFNEYELWRDNFFLPVSQNSYNSLSDTGHMFINIMDPTVKGVRYKSCDELVDGLVLPVKKFEKSKFVGQIGMRIMQRPKSDKLFENEKEKAEFMNRFYIENIWCFSKEYTEDKSFDYFRHARKAALPL